MCKILRQTEKKDENHAKDSKNSFQTVVCSWMAAILRSRSTVNSAKNMKEKKLAGDKCYMFYCNNLKLNQKKTAHITQKLGEYWWFTFSC